MDTMEKNGTDETIQFIEVLGSLIGGGNREQPEEDSPCIEHTVVLCVKKDDKYSIMGGDELSESLFVERKTLADCLSATKSKLEQCLQDRHGMKAVVTLTGAVLGRPTIPESLPLVYEIAF